MLILIWVYDEYIGHFEFQKKTEYEFIKIYFDYSDSDTNNDDYIFNLVLLYYIFLTFECYIYFFNKN